MVNAWPSHSRIPRMVRTKPSVFVTQHPVVEILEDGFEFLRFGSGFVFHPWRDFIVRVASNQLGVNKFTQSFGECIWRNIQPIFEFVESPWIGFNRELMKNSNRVCAFPMSSNNVLLVAISAHCMSRRTGRVRSESSVDVFG